MKTSSSRLPRTLVGAASVAVALGATLGSGSTNEASVEPEASAASPTSAAQAAGGGGASTTVEESTSGSGSKTARVGQLVTLGDWQIRVTKVVDPLPPGELLKPAAGKRFVSVRASVTNNSGSPATVSSLMCFELRDSQDMKFSPTITGTSTSQLDGEVAPGDRLQGNVDFEVDRSATDLRLQFKCDLLSSGSAVIALS